MWKNEDGKCIEILVLVYGEAFQLFFEKFGRDGELTEEVLDIWKVKFVLPEKYGKKKDAQETKKGATDATLVPHNLIKSMENLK